MVTHVFANPVDSMTFSHAHAVFNLISLKNWDTNSKMKNTLWTGLSNNMKNIFEMFHLTCTSLSEQNQ